MIDIKELAEKLSSYGRNSETGFGFAVHPIPGEIEVLQVVPDDREELPIFLSISDDEILCLSYVFSEDEVRDEARAEMHLAMLSMNVPMPLSSFARIDRQYVVFGALSVRSNLEELAHEIEVLSDNTLEAIEAMKDYLK
ncbi:MAG: YjfI family protein [Sphingomonadales bacterium]